MTIEQQITRIKTNISNAYTALETKGANLPDVLNSDNLPATIETVNITGGSDDTIAGLSISDLFSLDEDGVLSKSTAAEITCTATDIGSYGLPYFQYKNTNLTSVEFFNLTTINEYGLNYAFYNCTNLISVSLPKVTTIQSYGFSYAFYGCSKLKYLDMPNLTSIGQGSFANNNYLYAFWLPKEATIPGATLTSFSPFLACSNITIYTDATEQQEGWSDYWNYVISSKEAPVVYGCSHDEFLQIVAGL